ncbi:putative cell surface receptor/MFS transporter [Bisporella sp. PMI_857]|nr:putative cell surface receptor/MFS transporter [Bisporella sp. PMI_857]
MTIVTTVDTVPELSYHLYKRRWYGVLILTLVNLMTSCGWLTYSPISSVSANFYNVSENSVNNFSIIYMATLSAFCPVIIWMMYHVGFRATFLVGSGGLALGSWIRYLGSRISPPSYALTMVGQAILGMTGAIPLSLPSHYTNLWCSGNGKVAANAIMTLANPTGAVLAQVIGPAIVTTKGDLPNLSLYTALACSAVAIFGIFVPSKPPTPPRMSLEEERIPPKLALLLLLKSPRFWLFFIPLILIWFIVFVGFFNALSSLLFQIFSPYGVSSDTSGYFGAALIGSGLIAGTIFSPIIDVYHAPLIAIRMVVPIISMCYLVLIWVPGKPVITAYIVLGVLGAASFTLLPVTLEWLAEDTQPASPEVSSTLCWMGGQLFGVLFTLIMQSLKTYRDPSVPDGDMHRALLFQGVVAMMCIPLPLFHWYFRDTSVPQL